MPLSNPGMLDHRDRALATIHAALDAGCTLLDTSDIYAPSGAAVGHNERLVAEALRTWDAPAADRARVVVATKGGITRVPGPGGDVWGRDGRPAALRAAAEASLARLGGDSLDLYYLHRADPVVPYAEQIAGLVAVRDGGLARRIAVSNVDLAQLDVALEVAGGPGEGGICAVQNERSPRFRVDDDVVARCAERGIAYLPWSPPRRRLAGARGRLTPCGLRRGGAGARCQPAARRARLVAGSGPAGHPDPRLDAAGDGPGLTGRGGPRAHPSGARIARRHRAGRLLDVPRHDAQAAAALSRPLRLGRPTRSGAGRTPPRRSTRP